MGNLVGGPLDGWVQKQIKVRQESLANNSDAKNLLTNHNKTSWVRLASSVNRFDSNNYAKNFVLFGGVNFTSNTKGGIAPSNQFEENGTIANRRRQSLFTLNRDVYSYDLSEEQGLQPIPGLESVKIRHLNRGAIRKFDVKLKAQSKSQFVLLEELYLRLGYYMLLEWGHTNYLTNKGELKSSPKYNSGAFDKFFDGKSTDDDITDAINEDRNKEDGNYDGALFKVSNYTWNIDSDGSYNISIEGISKGGLLGSLTLNTPRTEDSSEDFDYIYVLPSTEEEQQKARKALGGKIKEDETEQQALQRVVGKKLATGKYEELKSKGIAKKPDDYSDDKELDPILSVQDNESKFVILNQNKTALNKKLFELFGELKNQNWETQDGLKYKVKPEKELLALRFNNPNNSKDLFYFNYIRFGKLLTVLQEILNKDLNNPPIGIDNTEIQDSNKVPLPKNSINMFTHWFQHSTDPRVCIIPTEWVEDKVLYQSTINKILNKFKNYSFRNDNVYQGSLMNMFVNLELVAECLENSTSKEDGTIYFLEVLDKILYTIQNALGGINMFNITYLDATQSTDEISSIKIFDDTIIPGIPDVTSNKKDPEQKIRLFGVQPNVEGSFVRKVTSQSKVSSNLATQISIGSTSSKVNNSTSLLSNWNKNLVDRVQEKSKDNVSSDNNFDLEKDLEIKYKKYLENFINPTYANFICPPPSTSQTAQSNLKLLLEYDLGIKTLNGNIAGKGFIPIDLSLELDGISGILMQQRIITDDLILPPSYIDKVNFIVQAIDHTIQNNEWTTTLSTLSVPKQRENQVTKKTDRERENNFSFLNPISGSNTQ